MKRKEKLTVKLGKIDLRVEIRVKRMQREAFSQLTILFSQTLTTLLKLIQFKRL